MKTLFNVRNSTGEIWPAYAMGRLGPVILRDGVNEDLPLYALIKPDGKDGVYVVNGASPLADGDEGGAINYRDAQRVLIKGDFSAALNNVIGAVSGYWYADDTGMQQFIVLDAKNERNVTTVVSLSGAGGETQIIAFSVASSDPATRSAIVQIEQRAFTGPAYGSYLEDSVVDVYDTSGCYLNEPNVDLTARRGDAVLMNTDATAAALHFPNDYSPPAKYWKVIALCCPNVSCEDA